MLAPLWLEELLRDPPKELLLLLRLGENVLRCVLVEGRLTLLSVLR